MACTRINEAGHLEIGGADTVALAAKYGTPLYVMDENAIRANCRAFVSALERHYDGRALVLYAAKALCTVDACRIASSEGLGLDVVSGGELYTAAAAGVPMERVCFHGNNKTSAELDMALEYGVGCIVVDNSEELSELSTIAVRRGCTVDIMFRIKPGVEAHTHKYIRTGQIDSKFGVALENGDAETLVAQAANYAGTRLVGFECHIGSQIFDVEPYLAAAEVMMHFVASMRDKYSLELPRLNIGGGYGIGYVPGSIPPNRAAFVEGICRAVKEACAGLGTPEPFLLIEPGRSIVGDAGLTLYTVGSVKDISGVRKYIAVDGGMGDNPRYALYGAEYDIVVADRAGLPRDDSVTVAGRYCESGDLLQESAPLQKCGRGDTLAVLCTGAYNYSMASNYNRVPRPAIVIVRDGADRLSVRRESYEDLLLCDIR